MSLVKQIKDLKDQIAEEEKKPAEEEAKIEEPAQDEPKPEPVEEPAKEEPAPKEEAPVAEEEKIDASAYARLRRELRNLKEELAETKRTKAQPVEEPKATIETEDGAQTVELPPVLTEIVKDYQMNLAGQHFNDLEDSFRRVTADYDDVSNAYKADLYRSIKLQNPRLDHGSLVKMTNHALLNRASEYYKIGKDPVEEMYLDAKELGYKAAPKEQPRAEPKKEDPKPDLSRIAANKERNSGMVGALGAGGRPDMTPAMAASLSPLEWKKLPKSEKQRLLGTAS